MLGLSHEDVGRLGWEGDFAAKNSFWWVVGCSSDRLLCIGNRECGIYDTGTTTDGGDPVASEGHYR